MTIEIFPLGAGQEVGRSCIIIKIYDKTIMLDCGLHMGYNDERRFPDFSLIKEPEDKLADIVDVVLLSHFHLDHCGALPYMSEIVGYDGPILMTAPTRAIVPYMLEDFRRVMVETRDTKDKDAKEDKDMEPKSKGIFYTTDQVMKCASKFSVINLHQTMEVKGLRIKTYYAGHVLGACMFLIEYRGLRVVYTGDFNSNADRHLGAAWIEKVHPDAIITETTYADTLRDSKRSRERDFLKQVQDCVDAGGKVLIPVFALGRAQELCILLETYWSRTKSKVPIYFSAGMTEKANFYYKLFTNWTNEKIKSTFIENNMFDFKYITAFDKTMTKSSQPMVLFATPGMLHGGLSMQVFKEWCTEEKNLLIIPGYCVPGTLGNKLLSGVKNITIDGKNYDIRMKVKNMSFSAHADAKGILQLIKHVEPKNVVFVHGEKRKMEILREVIIDTFKLPCHYPANFQKLVLKNLEAYLPLLISPKTIINDPTPKEKDGLIFSGVQKQYFKGCAFLSERKEEIKVMDIDETILELNSLLKIIQNDNIDRIEPHKIETGYCFKINETYLKTLQEISSKKKENISNLFFKEIKLRLNEAIRNIAKIKQSDLDTLKNIISLDLKDDLLLVNINKGTESQKLDPTVKAYLETLEVIISQIDS